MDTLRYALFGTTPAQVFSPESTDDAQEIVRELAGAGVCIWGGGTTQHVGYAPTRYDAALSTHRLTALTEHIPGNLTATVGAGMTVETLQNLLRPHGQWLPLDVAAPHRRTLGGIVSARAGSLCRATFGSVRDALLGVTVVNCHGERIQGGGRVVKNVAGYDLPKLYCGARGTLGLITEVTVRVAPLPAASVTAVLPLPAEVNAEDALDTLAASALEPSFISLVSPLAAPFILPDYDDAQYLVVGLDGPEAAVQWQAETLGTPPLAADTAENVRTALRDWELHDAPLSVLFHVLPSQVGAFSRMLEWTARRAGFAARVVSDAVLGIMRVHIVPTREDADWLTLWPDFQDKAERVGGSFVVERMPAELREQDVPVWFPLLADFRLMQSLKASLDPLACWNPGRFAGRL